MSNVIELDDLRTARALADEKAPGEWRRFVRAVARDVVEHLPESLPWKTVPNLLHLQASVLSAAALSGGLVVTISNFDTVQRRAIVQRRADQASQRFGVHFPPAVIDYISRVVISHGRDLDGAVNRLVAANSLTKEAVSVALAE